MADAPRRRPPSSPADATRVSWAGLRRRARFWSMPTWLIALCVAIFIAQIFLPVVTAVGNFNIRQGLYGGQLWRPISFQFLHGSLYHLAFNCLGLWVFGPPVERKLGRARFLAYYLLCGIGGAIGYTLLFWADLFIGSPDAPLIGASAGVFGLIAAAMTLFPNRILNLAIPPIDITVFRFGLVWLFIAAVMIIVYGDYRGSNAGGEAAHLGGAAVGFLLARRLNWLDWAERITPRFLHFHRRRPGQKHREIKPPGYMKYHGWR